jgi:hypothetical protein
MSISIQKQFKSIKREELSEGAKGILDQMAKATDNFKDYTAVKKIKPKFETFFEKIKASKPQAIVGFVTKPKRAKKTKANAARTAAFKRRQPQTGVPKGYNDIEKDARRPAISIKGKRTSKTGKTYYEYRDNRWDMRPKRYPKLEDGGYMADGGMIYKMANNMTDAEYEKKLSSLNEKQKNTYESLVRLGDSPKLALATTLLSNEVKWSDETIKAYTMSDGGYMADGGQFGKEGFTIASMREHLKNK